MGPGVTFYLDGAHTEESMASCGEWFHDAVQQASSLNPGRATQRVLLFNCMQVSCHQTFASLLVPFVPALPVIPRRCCQCKVTAHNKLLVLTYTIRWHIMIAGMLSVGPCLLNFEQLIDLVVMGKLYLKC